MMPKVVQLPRYRFWVLVLAAVLGPPLSIFASVQIANNNSEQLIERYRADRATQAETNKRLYCALFASQMDALEDASTPAGRASYQAWLDLYKLVQCQPIRK